MKRILFVVLIITMTGCFNEPQFKYTVYAADKVYYCNEFNVSGNTIYFKDSHKKNVCINGNYTLIYETEEKIK